jgi:hypothetical protein
MVLEKLENYMDYKGLDPIVNLIHNTSWPKLDAKTINHKHSLP